MRPPFRADHVGSLLRPAELKKARADKSPQLRNIEDGCIREAVRMQEAAGLQAVTDGEFRRAFWHVDFLTGLDGIVATQGQYALKFHGEDGAESETRSMMVVNKKVRKARPRRLQSCASPLPPTSTCEAAARSSMRRPTRTWRNSGATSRAPTAKRSATWRPPAALTCRSTTSRSPACATRASARR